jgi:uncharacterized protein with HEPN domain
MDERILKWLFDIKRSIDEIETFFGDEEKDFFKYKSNIMLKRAVERNLEITGEADNRILSRDDSFSNDITNSKAILGFVIRSFMLMTIAQTKPFGPS